MELAQLHQAYGGVDDDGAENGSRSAGEQRAEEEEDGGHAGGTDEGVRLRVGSGGVPEGGAARAAADRKAVQDTCADVGRPERQQLAIGVQGMRVVAAGEGAGGQDHVRVADEEHAEGRQEEIGVVRWSGQGEVRQTGRDGADDGDAVSGVEGECRHHGGGEDEHEKRSGKRAPQQRQGEEQDEAGCGQGGRGPVHVTEVTEEREQLGEEPGSAAVGACEAGQLVHDHDEGDAGEVTDEQGPGKQVREEAEPDGPGGEAEQADHNGQGRRERRVPGWVTGRERAHGHGGHQGGGRLRADGQQARGPAQGVEDHGRESRPQPDDGRQAGDPGVGHDLRYQIGGDRDPGQDVAAQPAPAVAVEGGRDHSDPSVLRHGASGTPCGRVRHHRAARRGTGA